MPAKETAFYEHPLFWLLLGLSLGIYGRPFDITSSSRIWLRKTVDFALESHNRSGDSLAVDVDAAAHERIEADDQSINQSSSYVKKNDQNTTEIPQLLEEVTSSEGASLVSGDDLNEQKTPDTTANGRKLGFDISEPEGIIDFAGSLTEGKAEPQILMLSSISSTETPPSVPNANLTQLTSSDKTVPTISGHKVFEMLEKELDSLWRFWDIEVDISPTKTSDFFTRPLAFAMVGLRLAVQHNCVQFAKWYVKKVNHWPDEVREEVMLSIYTDAQLPIFQILTREWYDGSRLKARIMEKCAYNGAFKIVLYMLEQHDEEGTKWWDSSQFRRAKNVALIAASAAGHLSIVDLLVQNGANIFDRAGAKWFFSQQDDRRVKNFNRPAFVADENIRPRGYSDFVRLLQAEDAAGEDSRLMKKALQIGSPELILCLLLNGVELDPSCKEKERVLSIALTTEHRMLIDMMLDANPDINNIPPICAYRTPLHCVATRGDEELVRRFIRLGSNVNDRGSLTDWGGNCALMAAASCGHAQVVRTLLDHGARIEGAQSYFGDVLQTVCFLGYADVLRTLIEMQPAGLNWNIKSRKGADLLSLAVQPLIAPRTRERERADNAGVVKILTISVPMFRQRYASRIPALSLA